MLTTLLLMAKGTFKGQHGSSSSFALVPPHALRDKTRASPTQCSPRCVLTVNEASKVTVVNGPSSCTLILPHAQTPKLPSLLTTGVLTTLTSVRGPASPIVAYIPYVSYLAAWRGDGEAARVRNIGYDTESCLHNMRLGLREGGTGETSRSRTRVLVQRQGRKLL